MYNQKHYLRILILSLLLGSISILWAQDVPALPKINIGLDSAKNPTDVNTSLQVLLLLTVLSLAPALMILTTAFTRIVIILSFIRTAMGTMNIPPNQVVVGLSMFLTFFVMAPTYRQLNDEALQPYLSKKIDWNQAWDKAQPPLKNFMMKNTYEKDLKLFLQIRNEQPKNRNEVNLLTLIPAFVLSELKTAFIIGFYIFVPFLMIDLIVSSALMSMGMMMLPPTVVSLPAKLLVFALSDGWSVLVASIMSGYS